MFTGQAMNKIQTIWSCPEWGFGLEDFHFQSKLGWVYASIQVKDDFAGFTLKY